MGQGAARLSLETHLAELARARELSIAHRQMAASVQAEHYRGKAAGLYDERLRLREPSDAELIKAIRLVCEETAETIEAALGAEL
jgi:hypothetical protein